VIAAALLVVDERHELWRAIHALLDIMERDELANAVGPTLTADQRHYNSGRAAALADVRAMLLQQWSQARAANRAAQ